MPNMNVYTNTPVVKKASTVCSASIAPYSETSHGCPARQAREAVMEFLLANHLPRVLFEVDTLTINCVEKFTIC